MRPLLDRIRSGDIDPTVIISHHLPLDRAPHGYEIFKHKQEQRLRSSPPTG
jgi:threonine dehydrogenase-like Zn-dependent dehydrogenase